MHPIRLTSFGYLHLPTGPDGLPVPPAADRIEDVRDRLRDPAAARNILDLDGHHPHVQDVVLNTPGARELLANLTDYALLPAGPRHVAVGCAGGKHRACGLVELLARELRDRGRQVDIEHLHAHLPRVLTSAVPRPATPSQAPEVSS
ncbi:RapZ C-terminal domain-containing protein [Streptomyces sp. DT73]|uniref:RapZ C-terminal domain-containing protein n=1 Tax=Streptomyces sp. DT73 TaxID=3393420 RepID=UPI003CE8A080